ncbi:arylesterase [Methylosinus sporium]|uniref:Arylesterase n=2 Tax=Methylosinus sporium TaxID=428 RepID=A0A2U1SMY3_METSR|nr:arylesterase [Methylosinus sporium]
MVCRCAARRSASRVPAQTTAPTYAKAPLVSSLRPRFRPRGPAALLCVAMLLALLMAFARPAAAEPLRVIAFGDSLSAGFQLPADAAFPAQLEARLKKDGYDVRVINASVSGDTTRGGLARLSYALRDGGDLLILELGANDMLLGFDPATTRDNLEKIVTQAQAKGLDVVLAGMLASANFGEERQKAFDAIFPDLSARRGLPLYPFFLAGVIGETGTTLVDGLHPSRAGVAKIVAGVAPLVEKSLDSLQSKRRDARDGVAIRPSP